MKTNFTTHLRFLAMVGSFVLVSLIAGCSGGSGGGTTTPLYFDGVVFIGGLDTSPPVELFFTASGSTTAAKISSPAPLVDIKAFSISPNRRYVAYLADPFSVGVYVLYVVDADTKTSVRVSDPNLALNLNVLNFDWAPDSSRVAYIGQSVVGSVDELYSVQPDAQDHVKVNNTLLTGPVGDVESFAWAPTNSNLIAYLADREADDVYELYTASARGAPHSKVNDPLTAGDVADSYEWSPDSAYLAYLAEQDAAGVVELYSYAVGGVNAKINPALAAGGNVSSFAWAPDSSLLAYLADQVTDGTNELFTDTPVATSTNSPVNAALVANGNVTDYEWAPDSSMLAYLADQVVNETFELWASPADGSTNARVNPAFGVPSSSDVSSFAWAPDSSLLAYRAQQDTSSDELYTAAPDGSAASQKRVNDAGYTGSNNVGDYYWSPDSTRLLYIADYQQDTVNELSNGAADGSGSIALNPDFSGTLKDVALTGFAWTPDGTQVIYVADQDVVDNVFELYVVDSDGTVNSNEKVSGLNNNMGDVTGFMIGDSAGVSDLVTPNLVTP